MMLLGLRSPTRRTLVLALSSAAMLCLFGAITSRAGAAELLYWSNYSADTVSFANVDGSGGGPLSLAGATLSSPEGTTIDPATGRLYVASAAGGADEKGQIVWVNLNGTGAGVLNTGAAPVDLPAGLAVNPSTGILYWANYGKEASELGSIGWAKVDGSGGGQLNTAGATLDKPYRMALDLAHGRLYWGNTKPGPNETLSFANLDNSGGGDLNVGAATPPKNAWGFAIDPAGTRIYWISGESGISFANLSGGGGGSLDMTGAVVNGPYGLAFDPVLDRFYWGNENNGEVRAAAIGLADLSGGGGGITIATAPLSSPEDPVVLKSPTGTGAPALGSAPGAPALLSCSTGVWAPDYAGSSVYESPASYAYQWTLNGAAIGGATANAYTATTAGSYACTVTATNQAGSAAQTSAAATIEAAKLKLVVKTKTVKVKTGKQAVIKVQAQNVGDLQSKSARLCVKVPSKAKADLKARCASLGKLAALKKKIAKLKVKVGPDATGAYKLKIVPKGVPGKAAKATLKVIG